MGRLSDRVALITGAAGGIGRASALRMAQEGAAVMCADVNEEGVSQTAAMIAREGGRAASVALDVTDEAAVAGALQRTLSEFGSLQVLHNNAGVAALAPDMNWQRVIGVNLTGVANGLLHGAPLIAEQGGGAIINTASIAGLVAVGTGLADEDADPVAQSAAMAYVASKHGVAGLTKQYAITFGARGVRVNAIAPGYIDTPMTEGVKEAPDMLKQLLSMHPLGRSGQAWEVASVAAFLASDDASFITGVVLPVDGGYTAQ